MPQKHIQNDLNSTILTDVEHKLNLRASMLVQVNNVRTILIQSLI